MQEFLKIIENIKIDNKNLMKYDDFIISRKG